MAKATKTSAPAEKAPIFVEPIIEYTRHNDPSRIDVPGWVFSWQNVNQMTRYGWGQHRPVLRDTDLGAEVARQFGIEGDLYEGQNAETNFFMFGVDGVLAYTSKALQEQHELDEQEKADAQMRVLGDDVTFGEVRHTVINSGPKRK
jgi:hypothetical protein